MNLGKGHRLLRSRNQLLPAKCLTHIIRVMNDIQSRIYKKEIADYYTRRSRTYDEIGWHDRMARKLVEYARIGADAAVLDIGTGTGMVAMHAASKLGPRGSLIGIDISEGMIEIARSKIPHAPVQNIRFEMGDGESLQYPPDSFDIILCGSAFIWMTDLRSTLVHWKTRLKPYGRIGFHAFSESAFITGVVAQKVLLEYGVSYQMSNPTGTVEKCRKLLEQAGFKNIEIIVDKNGAYIGLEEAKNDWVRLLNPAPGQYPHPLASVTAEQMAGARAEYEQEMERLNTDRGVWNDMTTFHVFGEKPTSA
jgi:ubiquinone/menaquinone biosynthesis C-methylase UbiE